ncbi:sterol desaturase family protein [Lutimonas sp.]|uniref:sterol desaturase family protein n=1 Tax=Lutimonas sp. TaxID=1872403 RepID=UPI003D9B176E
MHLIDTIDLTDYRTVLLLYLLIFVIILFRYAILSGSYYYLFHIAFKKKYADRVLTTKMPSAEQIKREIRLSIYSTFIFGLVGVLLIFLWQNGYTQIYLAPGDYPLWYFPISILLFMLMHDTYYYWMHKWMHDYKWLRRYHLDHHKSVNTTVLTSFSFHPVESFFQAIILPILFMIIPLHLFAILLILLLMTFSAIINHAGVEIYPRSSFFNGFRKYVIGATHHDIHHRHAQKNFGLYFTFWDKWMNTDY